MGFRAMQWFMQRVTGLDSTLQAIMARASWHCLDDDAFLKKSRAWLAEKVGTSTRSLERHEPTLAKLNLLVRGDGGYRLPQFFEWDRQNGGPPRQIVRQNVRQFGGAQEEGIVRKGNIGRGREPSFPNADPKLKVSRSNRERAVSPEMLGKIWARIAQAGRQRAAGLKGWQVGVFHAHDWDSIRLVAVNASEMTIESYFHPECNPVIIEAVTRAAEETGMLRGRQIAIVSATFVANLLS